MSSPFIGAYWGKREESAESCAGRLSILINRLGACHPLLQGWRKKGRSRAAAVGIQVETSAEDILKLLRTNNSEIDGSAISDLGFNLSLWNGNEDHGISFSATCGAFTEYVKNSVVLQLPPGGSEGSLEGVDLESLIQDFVDALDPDAAMLTSNDFIDRHGGGAPWEIGGWVYYNPKTGQVESSEAS